jgi:hypothetical protein
MVETPRAKEFIANELKISADEIEAAGNSGNVVRSLRGTPMLGENRAILGLGVKFALANG